MGCPIPRSNSGTPVGYLTIQLNSDAKDPEMASDPQVKGSVLEDYLPGLPFQMPLASPGRHL